MRYPIRFKKFLHLLGGITAVAGLGFVGWRLVGFREQLDLSTMGWSTWFGLAGLSLLMGAANLALALAWWRLLRFYRLQVKARWAVVTYGLAQLAKYVPGNVAHLAGRQALGIAAGLPGWPLARVLAWELGMQAVCGAVFALLTLPLLFPVCPLWLVIVLAVVAGLGPVLIGRGRLSSDLLAAWCWQLLFMAISAGIFLLMLLVISDDSPPLLAWPPIAGAFVAAWLIGFVTPGAPAGVGVRELVLLFLLEDSLPAQDLLLAVLLGRLVTVIGDLLFFTAASVTAVRRKTYETS